MRPFLVFFAYAALVDMVSARPGVQSSDAPSCENRVLLSSSNMTVGRDVIQLESISCSSAVSLGQLTDLVSGVSQQWQQCGGIGWVGPTKCTAGNFCQDWNPYYSQCIPIPPSTSVKPTSVKPTSVVPTSVSSVSSAPSSVPSPPPASNVCDQLCSDTCGSLGDLPPISEDCATIFDSITILNGSISPTFDVPPNSIEQLTFGTCRVFFENLSPSETVTYCWTSLANQASAAGTLCFPPTQPVNSLGLCTAASGIWAVGIAHS